ncbi:thiol reductant ABC exporter subunit CydD [Williamsia deligens]|uniref:Thiol reductant ABC exporter subunit CydD n=1 Tax=Williamsia deligens TaxID=321325 RepID=A0ABW3GBM4_9NOCA|nr:thiol reductant ABC exporter subunit CydD [Williamsia deligens]MCP2192908.1 ATP-binding cassette, subfamily C, CydD [Williamsia deligens]
MTASRAPVDPRLLRTSSAAIRSMVVTALAGVVSSATVVVGAVMVAAIVSDLVTDPATRSVGAQRTHLVVLLVVIAVRAATAIVHERVAQRAATATIAELRDRALRSLTDPARTRPRELQRTRADALTVLTRGLDALEPYLTSFVPALVATATVTPAVIAVMAWADPLSALIVVVTLPLIPVFMVLIGVMTRDRTRARLAAMTAQGAQTLDLMAGAPTLRAMRRAQAPARVIEDLGTRSRRTTMSALRIAFLSGGVLELLATLCVALVAVGIGLRLLYGEMSLYDGVLALVLAPEVYLPLRAVGARFHESEAGRTAAADVLDLIEPECAPAGRALPVAAGGITVVLDGAGVRDRDGWSPERVDAVCAPGTLTVITGPNGVGKSTVLAAIAGLIRPDAGRVTLNGLDAADVDRACMVGRIALTAQPPLLVPGTVADNLAATGPLDRLAAAAAQVGFDAVLAELPDGPATTVGAGGVGLSSGQRQRLALARALAGTADLLLLDEPTAHLDADAEGVVIAAVRDRAQQGATVIAVSHRPAVIAAADSVVDIARPLVAEGVGAGAR